MTNFLDCESQQIHRMRGSSLITLIILYKTSSCPISPTKKVLSVHSILVLLYSTSHHFGFYLFLISVLHSDLLKYLYTFASTKALKLSNCHICRKIAHRKHACIYFLRCLQVIKLKAKFCSFEQNPERNNLPPETVGISPFSLCQKALRYQGRSCYHNAKLEAV